MTQGRVEDRNDQGNLTEGSGPGGTQGKGPGSRQRDHGWAVDIGIRTGYREPGGRHDSWPDGRHRDQAQAEVKRDQG
jgi:hypothetical protein